MNNFAFGEDLFKLDPSRSQNDTGKDVFFILLFIKFITFLVLLKTHVKKKKIIELIKNIIYREKLKSDNNALKKNKRYVC